jgi:hypothetical protein
LPKQRNFPSLQDIKKWIFRSGEIGSCGKIFANELGLREIEKGDREIGLSGCTVVGLASGLGCLVVLLSDYQVVKVGGWSRLNLRKETCRRNKVDVEAVIAD